MVLVIYEIVFRIAWIFKTESVIIPAFVDALTGGSGSVRGWLPVLSRTGQSLPPLIFADRLRQQPFKRAVVAATSSLMALPTFFVVWLAWSADVAPLAWMSPAFLVAYVIFFSITGLNQLAQGTLHGKLVRPNRRGRLMWMSGVIGPILAIVAAVVLLGPWLEEPGISRFVPIFSLTAGGFLLCGMLVLLIREPADSPATEPVASVRDRLKGAWWVYRGDARFRRAAHVVMLLTTIVLIFPHFQWLARVQLNLGDRQLMVWVVAQNVGVAIFSPVCGFLADRYGNRLVMRLQCALLSLVPLLALAVTGPLARKYSGMPQFWMVFVLLGISPVTMRTISNYTLELVPEELHPQYLSTMRVCFLVPFLLSPVAGMVLDFFSEEPYRGAVWLFGTVSAGIAIAGLLTFRMAEPRHDAET